MNIDLNKAREIFIEAVGKIPREQWKTFLSTRCGEETELRRHVHRLLQAHVQAGSFLDRPAVEPMGTGAYRPGADEDVGSEHQTECGRGPDRVVGPYKLLQQIGEGGMGTVFMAEQTQPVQRMVALKIIKPGMDSRQVVARFEAERQALALMDHPHIAKVLDAGTTDTGRPYFVMELVKGVPITRYCDEHRLTPKQRLELFLPVGQAVQHAHQKGVIHRDLKPSNVLVAEYDDKPVPKVIDFGVAKATGPKLTERTMFTQLGQVVGTLEYMSPEQAKLNALDIDTRSDIYSLGVLLYELLTGSTPLDRKRLHEAALDEVLRIIREEEPPKPSKRLSTTEELPSVAANRSIEPKRLSGLVRGELDWIVMKALEKDRNRRYETANGLAMDVQRYLADEPVQACPPSAVYRMRKFLRRHSGAVFVAAAIAGAMLFATAILAVSYVEIERKNKLAGEYLQTAQENLQAAEHAVDDYFVQVSENKLLDVPGLQPLRKELLESALRYYRGFIERHAGNQQVQEGLAKAYSRVGAIVLLIGSAEEARSVLEQATAMQEDLVLQNPDDVHLKGELAGTRALLGHAHWSASQWRQAREDFERARELCEGLVKAMPQETRFQSGLAGAYDQLGVVEVASGNLDSALWFRQQAHQLREALAEAHPDVVRYQEQLATSHIGLGEYLRTLARPDLAVQSFEKACAILEALVHLQPLALQLRSDLANAYRMLGQFYRTTGQAEKASRAYERARPILERLVGENPAVNIYQFHLAACYNGLGYTEQMRENLRQSIVWFQQSCDILKRMLDTNSESVETINTIAMNYHNLGELYLRLGNEMEAARFSQMALDVREKLVRDHPEFINGRHFLAQMLWERGKRLHARRQTKEAFNSMERARALWEELARDHPRDYILTGLADLLVDSPDPRLRDPKRALDMRKRAQELTRRASASMAEREKKNSQPPQ